MDRIYGTFRGQRRLPPTDQQNRRKPNWLKAEAEERGMQRWRHTAKILLNAGKLKGDINTLLSEMTGELLRVIQDLSLNDYMDLIFFLWKAGTERFFLTYRIVATVGDFKLKDILFKRYESVGLLTSVGLDFALIDRTRRQVGRHGYTRMRT